MPYLAHIDVLGMSELVASKFDAAWNVLFDLVAVKDKATSHAYEFVDDKTTIAVRESIGTVVFSDTLLLYTRGSSVLDFKSLVVLTTEVFHKALCKCVPVRVGISGGEFRFDEARSMYAGPALIEAYRTGESAQWLGLVLSDSIRTDAVALGMKSRNTDILTPWQVPTKTGDVDRLVVNWPAVVAHDFRVEPPISVKQFYAAFESAFGAFEALPVSVQAKYRNTVDFINEKLLAHRAA